MRPIRLILAIFTLISASSCILEKFELPTPNETNSDKITVIGRVTRFDDRDVTTRGVKKDDETLISSMAIAIFPVNADGNALAGNCIYYQYSDENVPMFTIDRSSYTANAKYAIYGFANIPGMNDFKVGDSLTDMLKVAYQVPNNSISIPDGGFPMFGSIGDTFSNNAIKDNKTLILAPQVNGELKDPKVDNDYLSLLSIPMKALFAKINFTIEATSEMAGENGIMPQFALESYTVHNIPKLVDSDNATNDSDNVYESISGTVNPGDPASGSRKVNFSFYLPERYFEPATSAEEFEYPLGKNNTTVKGYSKVRDEDKKYCQRYKCKLVEGQKATNVVISGRYRDHQGHYFNVSYTIHLGADEYGDFNIIRNTEYHNYITIKGILNSAPDPNSTTENISVDHRVNVERTQPAIISLRREMLLDSHFEIRPLRIKSSGLTIENIIGDNRTIDDGDVINAVQVSVLNPGTSNWMRIERSFGDGTAAGSPTNSNGESIYITGGVSAGKRRYFTTDLISGTSGRNNSLSGSTTVNVPIDNDGECVWIYVDECTTAADDVRTGIIQVAYGHLNGSTFTPTNNPDFPLIQYAINQRQLFKVTHNNNTPTDTNDDRSYYIEYEEEYLHNFDSDESYGETESEGMKWGLNNQQLSNKHRAISFDNILQDIFSSGYRPYYDFYIQKYDEVDATSAGGTLHSYSGHEFCGEIIASAGIGSLALDNAPQSAVEYCYNKNKRNADGSVTNVVWYLPAIDEMEDIIISKYGNSLDTYSRFQDFQNKFYWSSQPAFIRNFLYYQGIFTGNNYGPMYVDNKNYARATKVNYLGNEKYEYVKSGLNLEPDNNGNDIYYNAIFLRYASLGGSPTYGPNHGTITINGDQTVTLREIEEQAQQGYKPRTEKARVRCVRKMPENNNE